MKTYPPVARARARHARVPAFVPVPQRSRCDGWTPERQARFLAELALSRSVVAAARAVGMARETAYRLRRKPGAASFAAAWDQVLGRGPGKRKVSAEERQLRAVAGLLKPHIYRGKCTGIARKADNSALLGHLAHLDRVCREEDGTMERSQSFAVGSAVREPPLPRRAPDPISGSRRPSLAPDAQGSR
jgi:hypothetical protein